MKKVKRKDVLKIILEIAESITYSDLMLNERYLHHFFSHLLQKKFDLLNLTGSRKEIMLHPEWPTYKKQTKLKYGRYKREGKIFKPNKSGTAGFIDFAIGDYNKPDIGIEFSLRYGWSSEEIIFDFLKLIDKRNPFNISMSLNIIFRQKGLVKGGYLRDLENHMSRAYTKAVKRLNKKMCSNTRELYLIVSEIDHNNNRRHWHYDRKTGKFENGLLFRK